MKDVADILALWERVEKERDSAVLATVVRTQGSSYRLPGARLLLTRTGQRAGAVSGGCLEDDLVKKAWWLTQTGPVVRRYDTTPDGELVTSGYGLGCNGIIHVLLERVTPESPSVLPLLREVSLERRSIMIRHRHPQDGSELFIETLTPPVRLLVFGAGDDAVPVSELARFLGWQVLVLDGRAHYARQEKFPAADAVLVRRPGELAAQAHIDPWTAAVIMTHSYSQDLEILRELANQSLIYLGVLGPRKRTAQLLSEAGLDSEQLGAYVHSPMGLDIGAEGAHEVALSVMAEIQASINARSGGSLRERSGSIHSRESEPQDERAWAGSIVCA
ncbi:MAG: XdhC family protein [Acidobacteriaceae bacterium]|nr:XdhC family protein [Acidobacteriaceae bacterium]MBV8570383.1 XdhC family protein [Acidobacteriaceae bacterium]